MSSRETNHLRVLIANQRKDRLAIDPIQLPLPDGDPDRDYVTPEDFVIFNGIRDAAPDGWGRHLMDRAAGAVPLSEFDYLVATGDTRVGALAFGPDLSGPKHIVPWSEQNLHGEDLDLKGMLEAVQEVDTADDLPRQHGRFHYPWLQRPRPLPNPDLGHD